MRLAKPDAWPAPVFVDEFDARGLQDLFNLLERGGIPIVTTNLNIIDRISVKTGRLGQCTTSPSKPPRPMRPNAHWRLLADRLGLSFTARTRRASSNTCPRCSRPPVHHHSLALDYTPMIRRRFPGPRTTTGDANTAPWRTCCGRIRQTPRNRLSQLL